MRLANIKPTITARIALLPVCLCLFPRAAWAWQNEIDVPIRNWSAPLYWMPSQQQDLAAAPGLAAGKSLHASEGGPRSGSVTPLTGPLVFVGITPCRLVDTRSSMGFPAPFGAPSLQPRVVRTFPLKSHPNCIIPTAAKAFSLNLLAITPGPLAWLSAWPDGYPYPNTSFLNGTTAGLYNNAVILAAGVNGGIDVRAENPADLIVDLNGYYLEVSASNRTLGGVIQSNGAAQSLPAGWISARTGTGQYVISFPANTLPAGSSPAPALTPIGAIATLQGASVVRLADGSGTLTAVWSNDITFSFVLAPN